LITRKSASLSGPEFSLAALPNKMTLIGWYLSMICLVMLAISDERLWSIMQGLRRGERILGYKQAAEKLFSPD
jgi:hypothetical protein